MGAAEDKQIQNTQQAKPAEHGGNLLNAGEKTHTICSFLCRNHTDGPHRGKNVCPAIAGREAWHGLKSTVFAQSGKAPACSVKRPGAETGTAITTAEFSRNGAQQTRYFFRPLPLLVVLRPTLRYIATFPTLCRHSVRFPGICILTATAFQARPVRGQEPQHHGIYLLLDGFCFTYRQTPF